MFEIFKFLFCFPIKIKLNELKIDDHMSKTKGVLHLKLENRVSFPMYMRKVQDIV